MKIIRAKVAGFCFGVRRAYELASKKYAGKVQTLGELIHNPEVLEELNTKGVKATKVISKIHEGVVIIRAHGISDKKLKKLNEKEVEIVDASCPFVKKIHLEVKNFVKRGIPVLIIGRKRHPELIAVCEDFPSVEIIQKVSAQNLKKFAGKKVALLCQTTEKKENFEKVLAMLERLGAEVIPRNTICNATRDRQNSAIALAKRVDVMVIVGGKKSNNTKQLYDLVKKITPSFWVESAKEIRQEWFRGVQTVGVSGGASTPQKVFDEVEKKLESW